MEGYSLGVIGGMGPKATAVFFDRVIEHTVASRDQEHVNMIILNHATLPDRTHVILNNTKDDFLQSIEKDIKLLEAAGVSNIAIPCNTTHYFFEHLQEMTGINMINMVDETTKEICMQFGENSKIGILATDGTISSGIYNQGCLKYNLQLHQPNDYIQEKTMKIIYNVKGDIEVSPEELEHIIYDLVLREKCSCVILACTELSCIKLSNEAAKYCVDAMEVLVKRSIELSGGTFK